MLKNTTKNIVIIPDGMGDEPIESLRWQTPLAYASTPMMDYMAQTSEIGLVKTVPDGFNPGSDTANMSILGYDPREYYKGRASIEASAVGLELNINNLAIRANLVTLGEEADFEQKTMIDFGAGGISDDEASAFLNVLIDLLKGAGLDLHFLKGYAHLLVGQSEHDTNARPPHDIMDTAIKPHLPNNPLMRDLIHRSHYLLRDHPLNRHLAASGRLQANALWVWSSGPATSFPDFANRTGLKGAMVTATDVIRGLARGAGLDLLPVNDMYSSPKGNYVNRVMTAIKALTDDGCDFVYLHLEEPDVVSHKGDLAGKIKSIENIDKYVLEVLHDELEARNIPYRMLFLPDHLTPLRLRTHTAVPVPYMIYDNRYSLTRFPNSEFSEVAAERSDIYVDEGHKLIDRFIPQTSARYDFNRIFASV
jgi:2,3-bisphosphoglycerate-independent phosphoglycerate mutase